MKTSPELLTITRPDDWHCHLRDGAALTTTVPHTARRFARAIVMPNLSPPTINVEQAEGYARRINEQIPAGLVFSPLMTLYLTDNTRPEDIEQINHSPLVYACKLYPAGATTNSDQGVTDLKKLHLTLEAMQQYDVPLLVHGEVTDPDIDIFDREKIFIERRLQPLIRDFPQLRIVFEHITTRDAVSFVSDSAPTIAATVTPQHLMLNRNAMLVGGIHPHNYCLPVLKREVHRQALLNAATSGNPKFFLGTDSAPHERQRKENDCGCAGIYTAHAAIELYADIFAQAEALDKLEGFASHYGADFYRLPRNSDTITLVKQPWTVPDSYPFMGSEIVPFQTGQLISWALQG
jgi:dihydroorotase